MTTHSSGMNIRIRPGSQSRLFLFSFLVFNFCIVLSSCFSQGLALPIKHNVLVINSYHIGYLFSDEEMRGIREAFAPQGEQVKLHYVYLDAKLLRSDEYWDKLAVLIGTRFSQIKFSAIIAVDNDALDFAIKYRSEIFADIPVVFCGINEYGDALVAGKSLMTGVIEDVDYRGSIEIGLVLWPSAKNVVIITDNTTTGKAHAQGVKNAEQYFNKAIKFTYLNFNEYTLEEMASKIRSLPRESFILYEQASRDRLGKELPQLLVGKTLSESAQFPVFVSVATRIGQGIVGGKVIGGAEQGRIASEIVLRIFDGESPDKIPVMKNPPLQFIWDYRALKKWGIPLWQLPAGSIILNKPSSWIILYKGLLVFLVLLLVIIFVLTYLMRMSMKARKALEVSEERYRHLVENANSAIIRWRRDGLIIFANEYANVFFGYEKDGLAGKNVRVIIPKVESSGLDLSLLIENILNHPEQFVHSVNENICEDGRRVWLNWTNKPIFSDKGEISEVLAIGSDITERKKQEEELKQRTEDLSRSNADLQQFAYVASHDLQEPLRMISSYLQLIKKRYRGKIDNDVDEFINFAVDGAKRMQEMIIGILDYSQIQTQDVLFSKLSSEEVLKKALINLEIAIQDAHAVITHDLLPEVFGDSTQLMHLFQNLISNAVKFRGKEQPKVHISVLQNEKEYIFSVRDNGIGIEPQYYERIFQLFQRLNKTGLSGSGIGLSICRRIVERHGGRIWLESVPHEGATFYFALPVVPLPKKELNNGQ